MPVDLRRHVNHSAHPCPPVRVHEQRFTDSTRTQEDRSSADLASNHAWTSGLFQRACFPTARSATDQFCAGGWCLWIPHGDDYFMPDGEQSAAYSTGYRDRVGPAGDPDARPASGARTHHRRDRPSPPRREGEARRRDREAHPHVLSGMCGLAARYDALDRNPAREATHPTPPAPTHRARGEPAARQYRRDHSPPRGPRSTRYSTSSLDPPGRTGVCRRPVLVTGVSGRPVLAQRRSICPRSLVERAGSSRVGSIGH
jgi:hypothetical protein